MLAPALALQRTTEITREQEAKKNAPAGRRQVGKRRCRPRAIGSKKSRVFSAGDQEPHRHNQANEQGNDPQGIQGVEAGRTLGVDRSDKGVDESAFIRIGSKCSFLHG